jgi:hypothetical protein
MVLTDSGSVRQPQEEFGVERLKQVIAANAQNPLPELAARILAAARGFGQQLDYPNNPHRALSVILNFYRACAAASSIKAATSFGLEA